MRVVQNPMRVVQARGRRPQLHPLQALELSNAEQNSAGADSQHLRTSTGRGYGFGGDDPTSAAAVEAIIVPHLFLRPNCGIAAMPF